MLELRKFLAVVLTVTFSGTVAFIYGHTVISDADVLAAKLGMDREDLITHYLILEAGVTFLLCIKHVGPVIFRWLVNQDFASRLGGTDHDDILTDLKDC